MCHNQMEVKICIPPTLQKYDVKNTKNLMILGNVLDYVSKIPFLPSKFIILSIIYGYQKLNRWLNQI